MVFVIYLSIHPSIYIRNRAELICMIIITFMTITNSPPGWARRPGRMGYNMQARKEGREGGREEILGC